MSIEIIGKQIALLRKERGIKQEELANYVGVSTQAVSKWENGGVPDTELLPKIADFFSVSVDSLFGRSITDYNDLQAALMKKINETPREQQMRQVFEYCWDMERAFMDDSLSASPTIADYEQKLEANAQYYSSIEHNNGFTRMGVANRSLYFLIVPDAPDSDAAYFNGIDYPTFFKALSDKGVFDACVLLNKREHKKAFTPLLFVKNLEVSLEKANQIIDVLLKYKLIYSSHIEMDDETQTIYHFRPAPAFIALLIFAREIIDKPCIFTYQDSSREKPYLT